MKTFKAYFTDNPYDALTIKAETITAARKAAAQYKKAWQIKGKLDRIVEVTP